MVLIKLHSFLLIMNCIENYIKTKSHLLHQLLLNFCPFFLKYHHFHVDGKLRCLNEIRKLLLYWLSCSWFKRCWVTPWPQITSMFFPRVSFFLLGLYNTTLCIYLFLLINNMNTKTFKESLVNYLIWNPISFRNLSIWQNSNRFQHGLLHLFVVYWQKEVLINFKFCFKLFYNFDVLDLMPGWILKQIDFRFV